ncbi:modification methylase Sau96I [Ligilactobacillus salivarius]|uniref:Modification methylase Sau96I n=3 Tax=Ligilactobacillus salivarius TaxID=1624 RepID=A0ABD6XFY3_9LACO|nr:hypothetical protein [Ligilactobacillus salivarius]ATP38291.1 modification methylase Sau96I [Ligilactobacillus salivarius]KRM69057.1 hypothetical protein FC55_GL000435 [Ligilactobacillus salivarius DSM 20555 = ATCC 11741]MBE7938427.1 modification methylase Sau96I [Ligilactobacillus salivarius]MDG9755523.1 modification methylase Sau96I [Ligilactobacillus salivarius]MDQ4442978.1 modification methylase Sau96I [Ligilactobacillus salivarius]
MSKKKSREYLMKLRKISDQGLIDPFEGDLGEFDGVTLKFVEPVSKLICKYTGKPYTIQWQRKIEEMRDLYQKWQIEMANNFEDGERRGYIVKKEDVRRNNERIETYLELGFGFKDFAKKVGYSEGSLRNKWNRTELEKAHNPCVIKNNILKPLSKSGSSRMGHKVSVGKKSRITDILLTR